MATGCFLAIVAVVVLVLFGHENMNKSARRREQEVHAASAAYRQSLDALKKAPANADLKEETLRLGRAYSNLTRNRQGVTTFDEVALMNDINAACAAAGTVTPRPATGVEAIEARLRQLQDLRTKGLISEAEYEEKRASVVSEL